MMRMTWTESSVCNELGGNGSAGMDSNLHEHMVTVVTCRVDRDPEHPSYLSVRLALGQQVRNGHLAAGETVTIVQVRKRGLLRRRPLDHNQRHRAGGQGARAEQGATHAISSG